MTMDGLLPFFRFVGRRVGVWVWWLPDAASARGSGGLSSSPAAQFQRMIAGAVKGDGIGVLGLGAHNGLIDWGTADFAYHPGTLEFGDSL